MNCPLCQTELLSQPHEIYVLHTEHRCTKQFGSICGFTTHYRKYPDADWGYFRIIEEVIVFPFKVNNINNQYHTNLQPDTNTCLIFLYKEKRLTKGPLTQDLGPGFQLIYKFPFHLPINPNLKHRLQNMLPLM
jgi:hypothetical protein